jgi:hypothetical protein
MCFRGQGSWHQALGSSGSALPPVGTEMSPKWKGVKRDLLNGALWPGYHFTFAFLAKCLQNIYLFILALAANI